MKDCSRDNKYTFDSLFGKPQETTDIVIESRRQTFPIVDVFAGPGGLGEGFASYIDESDNPRFQNAVSIECDNFSFNTLHLRHFLRSFPQGEFPEEYYQYLRGDITLTDLYNSYRQNKESADQSALKIELCEENRKTVRDHIVERLNGRSRWVLIGGPPCQAYSLVGRSRMKGDPNHESDPRHELYKEYLQIIADHAPPVFVMENVKGLLSARVNGEFVLTKILSDLKSPKVAQEIRGDNIGYTLHGLSEESVSGKDDPKQFLVRSEKYGVPQARHRIFIVGVRNDLLRNAHPDKLNPHEPPSVRQTIGDLPPIRSGVSRNTDSFAAWNDQIGAIDPDSIRTELDGCEYANDVANELIKNIETKLQHLERQSTEYPVASQSKFAVLNGMYDLRLDFLDGHETRSHMASDLRRYAFAASFASVRGKSPKLANFPESLLPNHSNVSHELEKTIFSDRFRVQLPDYPSTTITSHISKDGHYFIHYDARQCRSLTVREAARLQTFPDNYKFEGPRTAQYHQVGNAVPPYLAQQIAAIVAGILDRVTNEQ